jgi:hypothetical protein
MEYRLRSILSAAILAACIGSCSNRGPAGVVGESSSMSRQPAPIRTDKSVYTARRGESRLNDGTLNDRYIEFSIGLSYTNPTGRSIYLPTCRGVNPPILEKKESQGWVVAFSPVVPACLGPPIVIQPGRSFEYTYNVQAYLPGSRSWPQFQTEVPGRYRVVWQAYQTWSGNSPEPGLGVELPRSASISNEFELRE